MSIGTVIAFVIIGIVIFILIGKISDLDNDIKRHKEYTHMLGENIVDHDREMRQIISDNRKTENEYYSLRLKITSQLTQLETKFAALYDRVTEQASRPDKWT